MKPVKKSNIYLKESNPAYIYTNGYRKITYAM